MVCVELCCGGDGVRGWVLMGCAGWVGVVCVYGYAGIHRCVDRVCGLRW